VALRALMAGILGVKLMGTFDALIGDSSDPKNLVIDYEVALDWLLKKDCPSLAPPNTLLFASMAAYQKFMTAQRLAIIAAIIQRRPSSIRG